MAITNGYATLDEVKDAMRISDSVDDTLLETAIESASRLIDAHCERHFYQDSGARKFRPTNSYLADIDDAVSVSAIKTSTDADGVFDVTWTATDYELEPVNQIASGIAFSYTNVRAVGDYLFPYTHEPMAGYNPYTLQVTGTWGWSAVPTEVTQATILMAARQFKRYDSPLGVAGFSDMGIMRVSRVDPDIKALLAPYRKIRMA